MRAAMLPATLQCSALRLISPTQAALTARITEHLQLLTSCTEDTVVLMKHSSTRNMYEGTQRSTGHGGLSQPAVIFMQQLLQCLPLRSPLPALVSLLGKPCTQAVGRRLQCGQQTLV